MSSGRVWTAAVYKLGGRRNIPYWESLCADAPPHARITVGNKSLASAQQSHTASDRHNGWTTERPQTDSLVDIDVNDICLTTTVLDNSVSHQLFSSGYGFRSWILSHRIWKKDYIYSRRIICNYSDFASWNRSFCWWTNTFFLRIRTSNSKGWPFGLPLSLQYSWRYSLRYYLFFIVVKRLF